VKNSSFILVLVCFGSLFFLCYSPALVQDRQFGYRDAGHYYYPLHQRVQAEWNHGRWPLWEPEENAGVPLLGNPTAAVLYPGKLLFAVLPYPWAARIYIVIHTALAFCTLLVLLRSWGISWAGSGLGALSYTFGVPILFQYCNVIFLVGAAWLPLGIHAVDRWVRLGRRWAIWELAAVLSLQVLGGDPQAAYLLGISGAGYALGLAWSRRRAALREIDAGGEVGRPSGTRVVLATIGLILAVMLWSAATLAMGILLPKLRPPYTEPPIPPLPWMPWMPLAVVAVWGLAGLGMLFFYFWRRRGWRRPLGAMWLGLIMAATVAAALTGAQLLPVVEFTQQTMRAAASGPHDIYPFSVEPFRVFELIWPNIGGVQYSGNTYWPEVIHVPGVYAKVWVPSLYVGGLTVMLAASVLSVRRGTPWQVWLSVIAVVSLACAFGRYTSPIWVARTVAELSGSAELNRLTAELGPVDKFDDLVIRRDGFLRDGDGSIYWWLATFLPGFRQFRFPAKLFTLTSLSLAALAGLGWDQICQGNAKRAKIAGAFLIVASLSVLAAVLIARDPILATFRSYVSASVFGPLDGTGAYAGIVRSLVHCCVVIGLGLALIPVARARPGLAGIVALGVMTLDLAICNSRYVMTVEQSLMEGTPALVKLIEKAEAERSPKEPGPFRVHRMPAWNPPAWQMRRSADRVHDFVSWERDTIQPKYGINFGIEYTHTIGVAELYDYEWYFAGFFRTVIDPAVASSLGIEVGNKVIYFPRRAYDMWNTRYFIVPSYPNGWLDEGRAAAAFLFESESLYPEKGRFDGPDGPQESRKWMETQDYRVLKNEREFPRAWVVHSVRAIKPLEGLSRESRQEAMQEILYAKDMLWTNRDLVLFDPREVAWLSRTDVGQIGHKLSGRSSRKSEAVTVRYPDPRSAVLDVTVDSPGLVLLSDVYYPGWQLTVDGTPAPIYRVNGLMRGALVSEGPHRLVYTFVPRSWQIGLVASAFGLVAWLWLALSCARRPGHPLLSAGS
jgi:hypothetical protein